MTSAITPAIATAQRWNAAYPFRMAHVVEDNMLTGMCTLVQWSDVDRTFWSQVLVINIARRRDIAVFCNNHVGPSVRD